MRRHPFNPAVKRAVERGREPALLPVLQALFPSKTYTFGVRDGELTRRFAQGPTPKHEERHKDAIRIGLISPSKSPSNRYAISNPHC
jgi:hypothetical protein